MSALAPRRRQATVLMASTLVAALVLAALFASIGWRGLRRYEGGRDAQAKLPTVSLPDTVVAAVATVDSDDQLTSVTVFVPRLDQDPDPAVVDRRGGSIIGVPITADIAGSRPDRLPLYEVYAAGGADSLRLAVEGVLRLSLDAFEVRTAAEVEELLAPLGDLEVNLSGAVLDGDGPTTVFPAGPRTMDARQAARVLTARSTTQSDASRRPNLAAVWSAAATAIGTGTDQPVVADESTVDGVWQQLRAGVVKTRSMPALPFDTAANPAGIDVEFMDLAETLLVFATIAPGSVSAPAEGRLIQLEAPPGTEAQVKLVVTQLLYSGHNVIAISFASERRPTSTISVYDQRYRSEAEEADAWLGGAEYPVPSVQVLGVDMVIALGDDFLARTDVSPVTTTTTAPEEN